MVKLSDKLQAAEQSGKPFVSFEFFPPRTPEGVANLKRRFALFANEDPLFMDITWGAGGSTSDLTLQLAIAMKKEFNSEPNMHLTCTNMPVELIQSALEGAKKNGIENIVALRGDPPKSQENWTATEGGFSCALDLVEFIKKEHGDHFCVSVAGYPEGHPNVIKKINPGTVLSESEQLRVVTLDDGDYVCSDADYAAEIAYLKKKVDAGAAAIITQMFFDVEVYIFFVNTCRAAGITVPIIPGIMVIQNYPGFNRMYHFCKSRVPLPLLMQLEAAKTDVEEFKAVGVRVGVELCKKVLEAGATGLHFYTLNLEEVPFAIMDQLGLRKQ